MNRARAGETGTTLDLDCFVSQELSIQLRIDEDKANSSGCLSLLSCNKQQMGHTESSLNLFTAHWVYDYDLLLIVWIGIYSVAGKSVLAEVILCPCFLGVDCEWMWLITGVQLTNNNSLSFSDSVAFVHISLLCVSALGSRLWITSADRPVPNSVMAFPVSLEKKREQQTICCLH